jgi:hypothetical protein
MPRAEKKVSKDKEVQLLTHMHFDAELHCRGELKTLAERDANYFVQTGRAAEQVDGKWPLAIHKHGDKPGASATHVRRQKQREEYFAMAALNMKRQTARASN